MEIKWFEKSLSRKLIARLIEGLVVGSLFVFVVYFGSKNVLDQYLMENNFLYNAELDRAIELQTYVKNHNLAVIDDAPLLRKWAKERKINKFMIFREDKLYFDISYDRDFILGAKEIDKTEKKTDDYYFYDIKFLDGEAKVYLYEGADEMYYHILQVGSFVIGFVMYLWIFLSGLKEEVRYIQVLEKEVRLISEGDFGKKITIRGEDELASLAKGLNCMRCELKDRKQREKELRMAQEKLVLGMAHDLRTPLTGLLTYMEILERQQKEGIISKEYIDKAYERVLQIKSMSNQMFEYFFIETRERVELEEPEEIESAFGDYLSELYALLEMEGFCVDATAIEWKDNKVRINPDYVGRIMNNIHSNIVKYADKNSPVKIAVFYNENGTNIEVQNKINDQSQYVEGSGIGVKNIMMMIKQMGGTAKVSIHSDVYKISLCVKNYS